jgi:hypothetical protein
LSVNLVVGMGWNGPGCLAYLAGDGELVKWR